MPRPSVMDRVLDLVVELLLQIERLGHLRLRRVDSLSELGGGAFAELGDRESQLFPARRDRIVGLYECDPRLRLDLLVGQGGERIVRIGLLGHRPASADLGVAPRAPDERDDEPEEEAYGHDRTDDQCHPQCSGTTVALDLIGCERDRPDPVVLRGEGDHLVFDVGELGVAQWAVGCGGDVEAAAFHGDRQQVLLGTQVVRLGDGVGPLRAVGGGGEVVDQDHEEVGVRVLAQLRQARLDGILLTRAQHAGVVGDEARVEGDRIGGRGRGGREHSCDSGRCQRGQREPPFRHAVPSDRQPSPMSRVYAQRPTRDSTRWPISVRHQRRHIRWKAWMTGTDRTCWRRAGAPAA
ncbi:hypothetical protein RS85_03298 [Microbacterium sp. SA39]|nr:hypothetical protein RS85_03298 [Microbacterium sp. SA39]